MGVVIVAGSSDGGCCLIKRSGGRHEGFSGPLFRLGYNASNIVLSARDFALAGKFLPNQER